MTSSSSWLIHQWVVAGIVSSASRFVPIPFVDDVIREKCRWFVVSRTLAAHQQSEAIEALKPYYSSSGDSLRGCLLAFIRMPLKVLLFPIRKLVALVTSIHGVPLEIMRMVLVGRTLDRVLRDGEVPPTSGQAARMRLAFDDTFTHMDFRVIRAAVSDSLSSVSGWKAAAIASAKQILGHEKRSDETLTTESQVDTGAERVQAVLERPETLELFAEFDRRFDAALSRLN